MLDQVKLAAQRAWAVDEDNNDNMCNSVNEDDWDFTYPHSNAVILASEFLLEPDEHKEFLDWVALGLDMSEGGRGVTTHGDL